jgi:hypothetical protein
VPRLNLSRSGNIKEARKEKDISYVCGAIQSKSKLSETAQTTSLNLN